MTTQWRGDRTSAGPGASRSRRRRAPEPSRSIPELVRAGALPEPSYQTPDGNVALICADSLAALEVLARERPEGVFDMIFADPPYFLSNGGVTCRSGRMAPVDKGAWDRSRGPELNHEFNRRWLSLCRSVLRPDGTIWVSGTHHVIFSVGFAMQELGFKILNDIAWEKPNPPPNLSCRYFTHSTETVIWAARGERSRHRFNYKKMREMAGGKQMKSVWRILPPSLAEKAFGKHPTQKPLELVERCILASTAEGDLVLDPFAGSGTTAVACARQRRRCVAIELDRKWLLVAAKRLDGVRGE